MSNYIQMAKTTNTKFIVFYVIGFVGMFATGFIAVATYIPLNIKCMIAISALIVGIAGAITSNYYEKKKSEYMIKVFENA